MDALRNVLRQERIDRVIVGFGVTRESEMVDVFRACEDASVEIHVLPRFFELATATDSRSVDDVWGYPLLRLRRSLLRRHTRFVKRAFDASLAALALVVVSPLYVVIAAIVRITSPGPVHFRQQRVGERGAPVEVLKFRSMRVNSRSDVEWSPADESVTGIGRVLRLTGLDELPQLWNILKGDMSLVGPRPERPFFVEQFRAEVPRYEARHRAPAGLTGLAQVHGLRGDTSIDERARLDNQYIENWSLWRDVVILFQTFSAVIRSTFEPSRRSRRARGASVPASVCTRPPRSGGRGRSAPVRGMHALLARARAVGVRVRAQRVGGAVSGPSPLGGHPCRKRRQPDASSSGPSPSSRGMIRSSWTGRAGPFSEVDRRSVANAGAVNGRCCRR